MTQQEVQALINSSLSGYLTQTTADGRYIRTVNGNGPDQYGNVTVTSGSGNGTVTGIKLTSSSPTLSPDNNGIITLNIAANPIVELQIIGTELQKKSFNDSTWQRVADIPTSGTPGTSVNLTDLKLRLVNNTLDISYDTGSN
jgi:hypothetical protein